MNLISNFHTFIIVLFCILMPNIYGQEIDESDIWGEDPQTFIIDTILVQGNQNYSSNDIISISGLSKGDRIRIPSDETKNAIENLWNRNIFGDIQLLKENIDEQHIKLTFKVKELVIINSIVFEGMDEDDAEDIEKELNLYPGMKLTANLKRVVSKRVRKYLVEEGFYKGTVKVDTFSVENQKNISLKIEVNENNTVKIDDIVFHGNTNFMDWRLRWTMKDTRRRSIWNWFVSAFYQPDKYKEDIQNLENLYNEDGYRNMKVEKDSIAYNEDGEIILHIFINEGERFYLRNIYFSGNTVYDSNTLKSIFGLRKGDIYNTIKITEQIGPGQSGNDITTVYQDNGYLFVNISTKETQPAKDSIDIEIRIIEGQQATINKVEVRGNEKTNDEVIYRELRTRPGELFSRTDIKNTIREIAGLGFFDPEKIVPDVVPNPANGTVDLTYRVAFKSSSQLQLQGGYGAQGGFIGSIGFSFNNFAISDLFKSEEWKPVPMGDAQKVTFRVEKSLYYSNFIVSFQEPWLGGKKPRSFSTNLSYATYNSFNNGASSSIYGYTYPTLNSTDVTGTLTLYSFGLGLGERLKWPDYYFSLSNNLNSRIYELDNYSFGYFDFKEGFAYDLSYNIGLSRSSSGPNPFYPMSGSSFNLNLALSPPYSLFKELPISETEQNKWLEYYKVKFQGSTFNNIVDKFVFRSSLEVGLMDSYSDATNANNFQRFSMGGSAVQTSSIISSDYIPLRGYKDRSLTPLNGGKVYNKFTLDLRYPVLLEQSASVYVLSFLEGGKSWSEIREFSPFDTYNSGGFGVRILVPLVGLIGLDMGYGFDNPTTTQSKWEYHFSLNQSL